MAKVVIVNCFDTYEERIDLVYDFFIKKNHEVIVIESNFRHFKKVKRIDVKKNFIFIESTPYYKNMSVSRLKSHYKFAKKAFELVEELEPDILYITLPPNSLADFAARYKRGHQNIKLYFDIIDLWPETMPIGKAKKLPPFSYWGKLRDNNLKYADLVITECDLYQSVLNKKLKGIKKETLYLAKQETELETNPSLKEEEIHLCYLGSINNIIDISMITSIVKSLNNKKQTVFHIIGDGENKDLLLKKIETTGAKVVYYGRVYDEKKKQEIFDKCAFGLNIMKDTVCVGLTMKSLDYFQAGIPILNTISADTWKLVSKYNIGFNVSKDNVEHVVDKVEKLEVKDLLKLRENTREVYNELFTVKAFNEKMDSLFFG